jgi:hypothetical protein
MRKFLLILMGFSTFFTCGVTKAQSFTVTDTVYATVATTASVIDTIVNTTSSGLALKWRVINASNFPSDWLTEGAFGICDNTACHYNLSGALWNSSTSSGTLFTTAPYSPGVNTSFYLSLNLTGATGGTHWMTVSIYDPTPLGTSQTMTFIINKTTTGVPSVTSSSNDAILYPNPANNELNVVYDASADIKNIAVYNIIGKVMTVYKVTGSNANLNIENIPSGVYFVRLYNDQGNVVVTRKFTKQ